MKRYGIAICGAGIAGIATAHYLATRFGRDDVVLIDRAPPLSYTSSKSGENFRDYWPQACMAGLSARSIELMEVLASESGGAFGLHYSGYDFVSDSAGSEIFPSAHLRQHDQGGRVEQILDPDLIRARFPYLSASISQVVRIHRAGAFDVNALGMFMLKRARAAGVERLTAHVSHVERCRGGYRLLTESGDACETDTLVLATGPMNQGLAQQLGHDLGTRSYLQRKFVIPDPAGVIPRDMPFTIFADPQHLAWGSADRALVEADADYRWLLEEFPPGLHVKPEPGRGIKLGWAWNREAEEPRWQPADDDDFPNIVLRGACRFIPGLEAYLENVPTPVVQFAGYYTRTPENWPLIGPLDPESRLFTMAALSGFGTMVGCAGGELLARWIVGEDVPWYAAHFHPGRRSNPEIMSEIAAIESDGQL
ncbi:MAG: FAD-binding oxidoreductase [Xanthomonadales bacterium]|nr:FAD-binding oxidoreductase [Xanthomonadales bacterium]